MPMEAVAIHGLMEAFLEGMPLFKEKASELHDFTRGASLVAHNAVFDLSFLNAETGPLCLASFYRCARYA